MSKEPQQLLEDFKDLITSLKNSDKCNNPDFQKRWCKKYQEVRDSINSLPQDESDELDNKYKEWHEETFGKEK